FSRRLLRLSTILTSLLFFPRYCSHGHLPSFPTRRSSDLSPPAPPPGSPGGPEAPSPGRQTTPRAPNRPSEPPNCGKSSPGGGRRDRKSTRLNSSHVKSSYAVFCLKKKNKEPD